LIRVKEVHYISTAPAKHPLYYFIILFFAHTILLLNTHKNVSHMHFKRGAACMHSDLAFLCFFLYSPRDAAGYTRVCSTRAQFFSGACEIATQTNIYSTQMCIHVHSKRLFAQFYFASCLCMVASFCLN
jgi:hypothetical protein